MFLYLRHRPAEALPYLDLAGTWVIDRDEADRALLAARHRIDEDERSRQSLRESAADGDLNAALQLGEYLIRVGELGDAEQVWSLAAEAGSVAAATRLGDLAVRRVDREKADGFYRSAAARGDLVAATRLGMVHFLNGDRNAAAVAFHAASAAGSPSADAWLAIATGTAFKHESARTGDADLLHALGLLARNNGDERAAQRWLRAAADRDSPFAIHHLARPHAADDPAAAPYG